MEDLDDRAGAHALFQRERVRWLDAVAFAERVFRTDDGRRKRFDAMPFYRTLYEGASGGRVLLKTSRQSGKSTFLRDFLLLGAITQPGRAALYCGPTDNQVRDFARAKLDAALHYESLLATLCRGESGRGHTSKAATTWNVHTKQLQNGSSITLRSVGGHDGAERVRGITASTIVKDELQSFDEEYLPVIDACAATFDGRDGRPAALYMDAGTPLSLANPIERAWEQSKGYEWLMRCPHCSRWQEPLGLQHLDAQKPFLFCQWCGRNLQQVSWSAEPVAPEGLWVPTRADGRFDGFRLVRLMMPWARWRTPQHDGILDQMEAWPERRFLNETMAIAYDGAQQPVTLHDVMRCCAAGEEGYRLPQSDADIKGVAEGFRSYPVYAGLDWAMGSGATLSFTIFAVFAWTGDRLRLIFAHRFAGGSSSDPEHILARIGYWLERFGVDLLGADAGVGYMENQRLRSRFPGRVITFQYQGGTAGLTRTRYDPALMKHLLPRTASLEETFKAVKARRFQFPVWQEAEAFAGELLNVRAETSEATRATLYRRSGPDDFVHVMNYAHMVCRLQQGLGGLDPVDLFDAQDGECGEGDAFTFDAESFLDRMRGF